MWKWQKIQTMSRKIKKPPWNYLTLSLSYMNLTPEQAEDTIEEIEETGSVMNEAISFFRDVIIILIIVIFMRSFIVTPFRINGSSMEDSYHDREYILVDKFSYLNFEETYKTTSSSANLITKFSRKALNILPIHVWDPARGDVIVITPHVDSSREYYIKRVVGLPGESVYFSSGGVFIKKQGSDTFVELQEPYLSKANRGHTFLPEYIESDTFQIPENAYWVMWDNRNNSADSRTCFRNCYNASIESHFIKRKDIVWKVLLNFWYFNIFKEGGLLDEWRLTWTYAPRFLDHPRGARYPELSEE